MSIYRFSIVVLLLGLTLAGCMSTRIGIPAPCREELRLLNSNSFPLKLSTNSEIAPGETLGYQYLFLFMPFGEITLDDPEAAVQTVFQRHYMLKGYKVTFTDKPDFDVNLQKLKISALDFFFFRLVTCSGSLTITPRRHPELPAQLTQTLTFSKSQVMRYAFKPQLEKELSSCLEDGAQKLDLFLKP